MRLMSRTSVAVVVAISMSIGGSWSLVSNLQAASGPKTRSTAETNLEAVPGGGASVRMLVSASWQNKREALRNERVNLARRLAALEQVRRPNTDLGRRVGARLKRVLAILEIPDLPLSERNKRFEKLGVLRLYRGSDLVVKVGDSERTVKALGAPIHPALHLQSGNAPDGAPAPGSAKDEWEQDWENAQIDAEDTIVAIESLESEAQGWASDLEGYGGFESEAEGWTGDLEGDEGAPVVCPTSDASAGDSGRNCLSAVGAALAETLGAIAGYLGSKEVVREALANARNAITVAMGAFTAGTLTATGLAEAAIGAITALAGSTAAGWFAAAAIGVATAVVIYEIYDNCFALPATPESLDGARAYTP